AQRITRLSEPPEASEPSRAKATALTQLRCRRNSAMALQESTSQRRMLPSTLPEASVLPSGGKATEVTTPLWPRRLPSPLAPGVRPCSRTVLSKPAEARALPSGAKARALIGPLWTFAASRGLPPSGRQSVIVPSALAAARVLRSGEKATAPTQPPCFR